MAALRCYQTALGLVPEHDPERHWLMRYCRQNPYDLDSGLNRRPRGLGPAQPSRL